MFKVGDVVEYSDDAGNLILRYVTSEQTRVKLGCKGIVTAVHSGGKFYSITWFDSTKTFNEELELNLCNGISNDSLCNKCRDRTKCLKTRNNR
jgi:hypothetical protein